jgi:hypothetical protein
MTEPHVENCPHSLSAGLYGQRSILSRWPAGVQDRAREHNEHGDNDDYALSTFR